jgi:hypothetical protein
MKEKFLPWFLLFCALGLSGTAAYYSVVGLSIVFVGVALPVIIMGSFLEISKIAIATYLHDKWKETYGVLKIYLTIALVTLSIITSLGIYGLLSTGFQGNIAKLEINEKEVKNVEVKKKRFEEIKTELIKEKTTLDGDITKLRDGLSNNTTTQSVDRKTGQMVTKANNENRKSFESQLKDAQVRRDTIGKRIDSMNDSITKLDVDILNMESKEISGSELGALKYVSELLDWDIKRTANLFILILIFVFDPLAITLVIATNQAFKGKRKDELTPQVTIHDTIHDTVHDEVEIPESYLTYVTPQVDPKIIEEETKTHWQKEADRVWETVRKLKEEGVFPEQTEEEKLDEPTSLAFTPYYEEEEEEEDIVHDEVEVTDQVPTDYQLSTDEVEELIEQKEVENKIEQTINQPKTLTYANRNGGSFRISRI